MQYTEQLTSAYGFSASIEKSEGAVVAAYLAAADSWPSLPMLTFSAGLEINRFLTAAYPNRNY